LTSVMASSYIALREAALLYRFNLPVSFHWLKILTGQEHQSVILAFGISKIWHQFLRRLSPPPGAAGPFCINSDRSVPMGAASNGR
jgi:hypothetical protein